MNRDEELIVLHAFSSLLRTDYISLDDFDMLNALYCYYVDYFHKVPLILQEQDNIIVGRRGTGKTTLLYRAYIECLNTWDEDYLQSEYKNTTLSKILPIYIDLNKCFTLASDEVSDDELQGVFLHEIVKSLGEQIDRFWPKSTNVIGLIRSLFGDKKDELIQKELDGLARLLIEGRPFRAKKKRTMEQEFKSKKKDVISGETNGVKNSVKAEKENETEIFEKESFEASNTISIGDFLSSLRKLKLTAGISSIVIFIDEFSSIKRATQRKLSRLLKLLLGNKTGIYFKVSVISDNFDIGEILIPRDLTPIYLDLDDVFEGVSNLSEGLDNLYQMTEQILKIRLESFMGDTVKLSDIFHEPEKSIKDLSLSAMGVPRTIGFSLQRAWNICLAKQKNKMTRSDVLSGIRSVSSTYLNTFLGAIKSGTLPAYQSEIWQKLTSRAQIEKNKALEKTASHFHVLPKREPHLSKLTEYLLMHLWKKARTTKKDTTKRHLYSFDYGICNELDLGFSTDKNIIRQQRFVYDNELQDFDKEFDINFETTYLCKRCQISYTKEQLFMEKLDIYLDRCPKCFMPLEEKAPSISLDEFTEEESKIIGTIYAIKDSIGKFAYVIAEEVGCSSKKVANFAKKLEKKGVVDRELDETNQKYRYKPSKTA